MRFCLYLITGALAFSQTVRKSVCASGCDESSLATALSNAVAYQSSQCVPYVLELKAGETFGAVGIPAKPKETCAQPVILRSSRIAELPANQRVGVADAPKMAKISRSSKGPYPYTVGFASNADNYILEGLEITMNSGTAVYFAVEIGAGTEIRSDDQPWGITIDRCWVHGNDFEDGPRVGIYSHGNRVKILNSRVDDVKAHYEALPGYPFLGIGNESKAINIMHTSGVHVIENNYISSYSIPFLMGGSTPTVRGSVPSDLVFRGNHISRPYKWWHRTLAGTPTWSPCVDETFVRNTNNPANSAVCRDGVWAPGQPDRPWLDVGPKNMWECKNCQRVLVEGNYLERAWLDTSTGQQASDAFLFNDVDNNPGNGAAIWAKQADIIIRYNWIDSTFAFVRFGRLDPNGTKLHYPARISVHDNLMTRAMRFPLGRKADGTTTYADTDTVPTNGTFIHRISDVTIAHNTVAPAEDGFAPIDQTGMEFYGGAGGGVKMTLHSNIMPYYKAGWKMQSGSMGGICLETKQESFGGRLTLANNLLLNHLGVSGLGIVAEPSACNSHKFYARQAHVSDAYDRNSEVFTAASPSDAITPGDYAITAAVAALPSHDGAPMGTDTNAVTAATATARGGARNPFFDFAIRSVAPTQDGAVIDIVKPTGGSCFLRVDTDRAFDNNLGLNEQTTTGQRVVATVSNLQPATQYYFQAVCDGYRREGAFVTR
jgi:hypothetical protein